MNQAGSPLTGRQRRYLRSLAHGLKPVVHVGHAGVSEGVLRELDAAFEVHELLKVRVARECTQAPDAVAAILESKTQSQVAQAVGRILVLYRHRRKDPTIVLPQAPQE